MSPLQPAVTVGGLEIESYVTGPFNENTYLAKCLETKMFAVVDPGAGIHRRVNALCDDGWEFTHILLTHTHLDHIWDLGPVKASGRPAIVMHAADVPVLESFEWQCGMFGLAGQIPSPPPVEPQHFVAMGATLRVGRVPIRVIHTPGHSPGHVAYYWGTAAMALQVMGQGDTAELVCPALANSDGGVFSGDLVICGSIGRTDLPGGDYDQLMQSIHGRLLRLPPSTILFPGHCGVSTLGREQRTNAAIRELS